ncbi:MAG TPA: PA14 domain-containing protein, partial [Anaerolineae bacterium]|nr:PA14 domain-containing protein [Anaerolineae bacterium]
MAGRREIRDAHRIGFLRRWLLGVGLLLVMVMTLLVANSLVGPEPGLAAQPAIQSSASRNEAALAFTEELSHTVYFPFVSKPKPIVPNVWHAEYYANPSLSGDAQYTRDEVRVDYDWGDDGAPSGLPLDHFSIRWTGHWDFEVGVYTFFVFADDGVRLWLDDQLLIDYWDLGREHHYKAISVGTAGLHRLRLEYFEHTGGAAVRLHWRRTDLYPRWNGEYFNQPWVEHGKQY